MTKFRSDEFSRETHLVDSLLEVAKTYNIIERHLALFEGSVRSAIEAQDLGLLPVPLGRHTPPSEDRLVVSDCKRWFLLPLRVPP